MTNFFSLDYLKSGTDYQKSVYQIIEEMNIMEKLCVYHPILAGTIPLDIHIGSSDLDILCEVHHFPAFQQYTKKLLGHYAHFKQKKKQNYLLTSFMYENFPIEIFAQNISTDQQNGYRHMVIEERLLTIFVESFKSQIITLKQEGWKTEPAFAKLLQLEGDPYLSLLNLLPLSNVEVKHRFTHLFHK
jgi:hypothetical protein